ncbi:MAG: hypothetical protein QOF77_1566 [Solirubrobacteraceae bacterium]|nr:hypothetical protein [Solirubrobacteraceae bacterium]
MISGGAGFGPTAGGLISYYDGLLGAFGREPTVTGVKAFVSPHNGSLAVPDHPKIATVACRGLPSIRSGRVLYEQTALALLSRREGIDVLLSTCNTKPFLRRAPTVIVLQSLQHFLLPRGQIRGLRAAYIEQVVPRALRDADVVIAVSETERVDAIRLFGLDPERVLTVHHGMSNWAREIMDETEPGPAFAPPGGRPYVLIVSRLYALKNHARLIEAFAQLVGKGEIEHELLIAGGDADIKRRDLERLAAGLGVGDRVRCLGPVPQAEIPALFRGADAIAYPSLYETFGHPVLEAFAFGKPLLTSAHGATPEVAGGAAVLSDPTSVEAIADGLRTILLDDAVRARLARAGPRRARDFTWQRCAAGTLRALRLAVTTHEQRSSRRRG